ncbi:MAG TPA: phosphoribosylformylglycinamidine cyclo-ligase [Candidatus Limnocylindrales bacterium]|nr:phosphoribosylformylglycinamidine cyclo-ligase [Candidatus Limnocylindrales bacterium]
MTEEMNYRKAGVDIEAGEAAVDRIKGLARSTFRPEVLTELGGFGGLFKPDLKDFREPVLVAGCDGVGTKLKIAFATGRHNTVGIDCVAMCVNDILVQGAEPLFFLDYLAVGTLVPAQVEQIVAGVAHGCRLAGCALLGGETAEMPSFYPPGEYDLAGFAVGLVDRSRIIDGSAISTGDTVIGLASDGLHSNGFALARKVLLEKAGLSLHDSHPKLGTTLAEEMLRPTHIYVKAVLETAKAYCIKGMANITGGGLPGNLPRMLPKGLQIELKEGSWPIPPIFEMIQQLGPVSTAEMYRAFNMGIGFALVVSRGQSEEVIATLARYEITAWEIGAITAGSGQVIMVAVEESL